MDVLVAQILSGANVILERDEVIQGDGGSSGAGDAYWDKSYGAGGTGCGSSSGSGGYVMDFAGYGRGDFSGDGDGFGCGYGDLEALSALANDCMIHRVFCLVEIMEVVRWKF